MDVARLLLTLGVLLLTCQALGVAARRLGQPAVVGELIGGLCLGPSLFGAVAPTAQEWLFPQPVVAALGAIAQIGVVLFMLDVGLRLDVWNLAGQGRFIAVITASGMVIPFAGGCLLGLALWSSHAGDHGGRLVFMLFVGAAMAVTAFPVLARILDETGLTFTRLGTRAIAVAAMDDVLAWTLLAAVSAAATGGTAWHAPVVLLELVALASVWLYVASRLALARPPSLGVACAAALLMAAATEAIGLHAIFGAFLAGVALPRGHAAVLSEQLTGLVQTMLLPVFFVFVGLETQVGSLRSGDDLAVLAACLVIAVSGKVGGVALMARLGRSTWREATALGVLMNTRGLTELVVLVVGLNLGVLNDRLFTSLVIMAVVTTAMTSPLLRLLGYQKGSPHVAAIETGRQIPSPAPAPKELPSQVWTNQD